MTERVDTSSILLTEPLDAGFVKLIDVSEERGYIPEEQVGSGHLEPQEFRHQKGGSLYLAEWLANGVGKFRQSILVCLAAIQIDLLRLSQNNIQTAPLDAARIVNLCEDYLSSVISVSLSLIMPRAKVQDSSLLAPSGAYLTWMEMLKD